MWKVIFPTWTNRCCHGVAPVSFINGESDCQNIPDFRVNKTKKIKIYETTTLTSNVLTAQKVCVFGVFLVCIFPHFDWIRNRKIPNKDTFHAVSLLGEAFSLRVSSKFTHQKIRWNFWYFMQCLKQAIPK